MIEASVSQAMGQMDIHLQEGMKYFDSEEFKAKMDKVGEKVRRMAEKVEPKQKVLLNARGSKLNAPQKGPGCGQTRLNAGGSAPAVNAVHPHLHPHPPRTW